MWFAIECDTDDKDDDDSVGDVLNKKKLDHINKISDHEIPLYIMLWCLFKHFQQRRHPISAEK